MMYKYHPPPPHKCIIVQSYLIAAAVRGLVETKNRVCEYPENALVLVSNVLRLNCNAIAVLKE